MPVFTYQAIDTEGRKVTGNIEARSRREVFGRPEFRQLQLLALKEVGALAAPSTPSPAEPKVKTWMQQGSVILSRGQIIVFTEELSDLLEAGLQLEMALRAMEQREELGGLKALVAGLREKVVEGVSFSAALRSVSGSFGELYCNLVAAGEISGSLSNILRRQARSLQAIDELQSRVVQALIYPSFIFGAGILLIVVFMSYLVPQLTKLLSETGKKMPLPTRIMIHFSDFMVHYGPLLLALVVVGVVSFLFAIRQPAGRRWWDEKKLKIPLFGKVLAARYYAQFSQTLANLVMNGIPLLNGLKLVQAATPNLYLTYLLTGVIEEVGEGRSFSKALKKTGYFPARFIDMVAVGEQTGEMGVALEKVSNRYDKELSRKIQRLTSLIQPVIIVVMSLLVGFVAYSMISGIFQTIAGLRTK